MAKIKLKNAPITGRKGSITMKKQSIPQEFLDAIGIGNAKAVKKALDRHRLSQKWLIYRLDQDFGIELKPSELSELLNGSRPIGPVMQRAIWCAEQVIAEYESFYNKKRRKK
jgi:hypothetical protein